MSQLPPISSFLSISAKASTGPGLSCPTTPQLAVYSMQVVVVGGSSAVVKMEGTDDNGLNWFVLATFTIGTQTSGDIVVSSGIPCQAIRANYVSGTGTVTAYLDGVGYESD